MGKYLDISEIKALQIDITSKCNLMCPQCSRVENGKLNPLLPLMELSPKDYDIIFSQNCPSLEEIVLNGNYGDPAASKYIDYLIEKTENKNIRLKIFTNGSLRAVNWWRDLGKKFKQTDSMLVFSIDGLKDTNSIYRINSDFDKIMDNVQAYITEGGKARWDFLVFEHNYHQVETAKKLAKKLGFTKFQVKYTTRFLSRHLQGDSKPIYNKKTKKHYEIKKAPKVNSFEQILKNKYKGSYNHFLNETPVQCKYKNWKSLFIDFSLNVYPCCWIGLFPYDLYKKEEFNRLTKRYSPNFNSLKRYSLEEILNHRWFAHDLAESWSNKVDSAVNPRWIKCSQTCSADYGFTNEPKSQNNILYQL